MVTVTVNVWLSVDADEDDLGNGGVSELLVDSGPRWARSDEETVTAIAETVSEIITRASILHELGIPARQQ